MFAVTGITGQVGGAVARTEEAIKDPFMLEFLDLKDEYSETDLEEALIQHLTDFLIELGDDFVFPDGKRGSGSMTHGSALICSSFTAVFGAWL